MDIADFDSFQHEVNIPEDFRLAEGVDAVVWKLDSVANDAEPFGSKHIDQPLEQEAHVSVGEPAGEALQSMRRSRSPKQRVPLHRQRRGAYQYADEGGVGDGRNERGESFPEGPPRPSRSRRLRDDDGGDLCARSSTASSSGRVMGGGSNPYVLAASIAQDEGSSKEATTLHPGRDGGHSPAAHREGDEDVGPQRGEGFESGGEEGGDSCSDRSSGGISQPFKLLERRGGDQHRGELSQSDDCISLEEAAVANASEGCSDGDMPRSEVEEESEVASDVARQRSGSTVGSSRSTTTAPSLTSLFGSDVRRRYGGGEAMEEESWTTDETLTTPEGEPRYEGDWESEAPRSPWEKSEPEPEASPDKTGRPQRGLSQQMKKEVQVALATMDKLRALATWRTEFMVLEVFAGKATLSRRASSRTGWGSYEPVDVVFGQEHDLRDNSNQKRILEVAKNFKPDLVVITPPCGPWCSWQRLRKNVEELDEIRSEHLPFWRLARKLWDLQTSEGRLAMTEQPEMSEALETSYMTERPELYRVILDQCMFNLKDPVSKKFYKKATAFDVNDKEFAEALAMWMRCSHTPEEHEQIKGSVHYEGRWWRRSTLAARWTKELADHILRSAERVWHATNVVQPWSLAETTLGQQWLTVPVEVQGGIMTPEEALRQQLTQMGASGERYDYVTFEGAAGALPRRIRAMLAHLHVAMGHLSNDRLARMLTLAGGNRELLEGARQLRCQVCCMVRPPGSKPQVSYLKPSNFNQRVSADCFHVWDKKNVKYTVFHMLDELTDYHVGELDFDQSSGWVAGVMREKWYDIFGPPDVLVTDGGTEFLGTVSRLNDLFAVQHDLIPDQAKWRLGHVERHGAIVKVMIMKMVAELNITDVGEMKMAATAAFAAKNRLVNEGGVSPIQAVTGRNNSMPASLLAQMASGRIKFKLNEELELEEALRRAERIRSAAIEACHWLDAHQGLRRALNARSRPPHLEMLKEGNVVYVYDPPANRKGLARRLQDNASWSGPGVVVCIERTDTVPKKVWVRIKARVKAYPLEKLRLATCDEMISAEYITGALREVQEELDKGRMKVTDTTGADGAKNSGKKLPAIAEEPAAAASSRPSGAEVPVPPSSSSSEASSMSTEEQRKAEAAEKRRQLTHDVPQALRKAAEPEPHLLPFAKRQKLFEKLAQDLGAPSKMEEAKVRARMEKAFEHLKDVRKAYRKSDKEESRRASTTPYERPRKRDTYVTIPEKLQEQLQQDGGMETIWEEVEEQAKEWLSEDPNEPYMREIVDAMEKNAAEETKAVFEAKIITGKERLEYRWSQLDDAWKAAYKEPLIKAVRVYFEHNAISGVPKDAVVDPRKILTSRFVLTNKGEENLDKAELKGRWVLGGHRDSELGKYPTMAPTASLLGHNLLNFVAVQKGWEVNYEDVSAAFLQGKRLPEERVVYVKLPSGYPSYVNEFIQEMVGTDCRDDLLKLDKGGFGLVESPRLWYLEYKATLADIGINEMKLIPGMFRAFHPDGRLRAVVCIHVDDTRYAGDPSADQLWKELHERLRFGQHRKAVDGYTKFCGRYERQDAATKEFVYSMDDYIAKIPDNISIPKNVNETLTDEDRVKLSSVLGQINWAARQGRYDLSYGVSHCQQLIGVGTREALDWTRKLYKKAKEHMEVVVPRLGCDMEDLIVVSASDAAFAAQPKSSSQGGVVCMLAHPSILEGQAPVAIMEAQSMKIQRIVRCSMSAELSMAAESFEHGDYIRAVLAELLNAKFELRRWKWYASRWRHYLVIDAKTGYDVLNSESMTSDRKIMIDAAVLREALVMEGGQNYVRWMPGREMISDGLTKWADNQVLRRVMTTGKWSLVDTPEAKRLREEAAYRKKRYVQGLKK